MSRKKIIIGNWKMNNGPQEAHDFLHELEHGLEGKKINVDFAIAAPFLSLPYMMPHAHGDHQPFELPLAAQNFHFEKNGAFTGEVSLGMLEQLGIDYGIVGHSERRQMFNETDETVNKKVKAAFKSSLIPVMAYGETLEQFEKGETNKVIETQLTNGLKDLDKKEVANLILAYEPIWAIGTGKTATPEQAQNACKFSRSIIEKLFDKKTADSVRIQYGGSVNPSNVKELMSQEDIDGALVGGASLDVKSFIELITFDN